MRGVSLFQLSGFQPITSKIVARPSGCTGSNSPPSVTPVISGTRNSFPLMLEPRLTRRAYA